MAPLFTAKPPVGKGGKPAPRQSPPEDGVSAWLPAVVHGPSAPNFRVKPLSELLILVFLAKQSLVFAGLCEPPPAQQGASLLLEVAKAVLDRVGVVSDQLLAGSIVGSLIIAGMGTAVAGDGDSADHRIVLYYIATALIILGFALYTYARLFSVSSEQELAFREEGKDVVNDHRSKARTG